MNIRTPRSVLYLRHLIQARVIELSSVRVISYLVRELCSDRVIKLSRVIEAVIFITIKLMTGETIFFV